MNRMLCSLFIFLQMISTVAAEARVIHKKKKPVDENPIHVEDVSEVAIYPTWLENPSYLGSKTKSQETLYLFAYNRLTLTEGNFAFEVQPELRAVQSSATLTPEMRTSVSPPDRLMDLHARLSSRGKREGELDIERLNASYRVSSAQFSAGRKPVSLGVLSVFPVWNKFSRPLVTDYGPLRTFSQDQVSLRVQEGEWLWQALDIEERDARPSGATRVGEVAWFGDGVELHLLGGEWWQSGAFGVAAVKDLLGTSIRLEEISFSGDGVQAGLGAERAFSENWSALVEFMYLESGAAHKRDYSALAPSRFRPLSARDYGYARLEYKPSPLWILQLGELVNLVDSSQLAGFKAIYSAANDFELTGELRVPTGSDSSELSRHILPTQLIAGARYDF